MLVTADGTAATARTAFNTSLVQFNDAGRQVYANSSDAQVPSALADVVDTVLGLQNVVTAHTNYHLARPAQPGASVTMRRKGCELNSRPRWRIVGGTSVEAAI